MRNKKLVEMPCVTIDSYSDEKTMTIHNYTTMIGRMTLTKAEASLLLIELWKFIEDEE